MADEKKTCRICLKPFQEYPMGEKGGYKFTACGACGSVLPSPWPTPDDLDKFFGDIQPEIVHLPSPQGEISKIKKLLQKIIPYAKGKRFLDISCRQGYGVAAAKELGLKAKGIDSHNFFAAFAKDKYGAEFFEHSSAMDFAARGEQADIVYSIESFCEQPDPESLMAALAKIVPKGGILYLQEPDGNHFLLPKTFTNWAFIDPPINFAYLSKKGMETLLKRHGFKIQKSLFTWAPFMRLIAVKS